VLTAVLLALAAASGAHPVVVALAALSVFEPRLVIIGLVAWAAYGLFRRGGDDGEAEATFLRAVGSELRGGATLRLALADAAAGSTLGLTTVGRLVRAGMPMGRVGDELRRLLPVNGAPAAAAVELSGWSGARVASVFEALAERAADTAELRREQRTATTQARLSAWIVGLAPLIFTGVVLAGGGASSLGRAGGAGYAVMAVGVALEVLGLAAVVLILRRATR
jgi:Flp pilus assembly protein TadB